jgi:hypothetical protein
VDKGVVRASHATAFACRVAYGGGWRRTANLASRVRAVDACSSYVLKQQGQKSRSGSRVGNSQQSDSKAGSEGSPTLDYAQELDNARSYLRALSQVSLSTLMLVIALCVLFCDKLGLSIYLSIYPSIHPSIHPPRSIVHLCLRFE